MKQLHLLILSGLLFLGYTEVIAQPDDATLFSIGPHAVTVGEFNDIYAKNNSGNGPKSTKAEYLELYQNFKVKVHHARQQGLDTLPRIKQELAGYREQLARSYMNDDNIIDQLVEQVYERMGTELSVKHILIPIDNRKRIPDTLTAYKQITSAYQFLEDGKPWQEVVTEFSADRHSKLKDGHIGYVKAPLPKGYYHLENTLYTTPTGSYSAPVRSPRGYHIVMIDEQRPAKPEVEVAHLFIRKSKDENAAESREKINALHQRYLDGERFDNLVTLHSEDKKTSQQQGRIGFVKPGAYEDTFEEAVYSLTEDGQVSAPVETSLGFHLIQRLSIKERGTLDEERRFIMSRIRNTERSEIARQATLSRISSDLGLQVDEAAREEAFLRLDNSVFSYKWQPPALQQSKDLLTYADGQSRTIKDFFDYLINHPKDRVKRKNDNVTKAKEELLNSFISATNLELEKANLEQKHPEFASLMREYEEGILLFEVSKNQVWDRASTDTVGLRAYYEQHKSSYTYPEEAEVATYNILALDEKNRKKFIKRLNKASDETTLAKYPDIKPEIRRLSSDDIKEVPFRAGAISTPQPGEDGLYVHRVITVYPAKTKPFEACRGYVIADYQQALEAEWVDGLKQRYPISVDKNVADKLTAKR